MAEIFTAKLVGAMGFEKRLVVKRILPDFAADRSFVRMLATEAKLVCNLEHPNIVQVYELGEVDGRYYIAMEYVNGIDARTLWRTLARRGLRLPIPLAMFVVSEFLKGLDYAHNAIGPDGGLLGVVHRDVSPSNILVSFRGDVKIGDFGIALVQQRSQSRISSVKGKFGYMTPEQLRGKPVDHRSDIFASGIVLAELLMGRRLFRAESEYETMRRVAHVDLRVLDEHETVFPPEVLGLIRRALLPDPDARYPSATAFHDAINDHLHQIPITGRALAAFIANHVTPYIEQGGMVGQDPATVTPTASLEPQTVSHGNRELTPSSDLDEYVGEDDTIPGEVPDEPTSEEPISEEPISEVPSSEGQVVDWSMLELVYLDGTAPEQKSTDDKPDDTKILDGIWPDSSQWQAREKMSRVGSPAEDPASPGQAPPDAAASDELRCLIPERPAGARGPELPFGFNFGEMEFDFSDATETPLKTADEERAEKRARLEAELNRPAPVVEAASDEQQVSRRLEPASADEGAAFHGALATHSVARVLFRLWMAQESGLLVLTGPGCGGRQAEIQRWLAGFQAEIGSAADAADVTHQTCQIELNRGQAQRVCAERTEEALAAHLVRAGVLTQARLADALRARPDLTPVAALVASNTILPLQITRQLTPFVQWSVLEAFAWSSGDYAFHHRRGCDEPHTTTSRGLELLFKGVSHLDQLALDRYLQPLSGQALQTSPAPVPPDQLALAGPVAEVYEALRSPAAPEQVLTRCRKVGALKVKQALYLLLECGLVRTLPAS